MMFFVLGRAVWIAELFPTEAAPGRLFFVRIGLAIVALVRVFVPCREEARCFAEAALDWSAQTSRSHTFDI